MLDRKEYKNVRLQLFRNALGIPSYAGLHVIDWSGY